MIGFDGEYYAEDEKEFPIGANDYEDGPIKRWLLYDVPRDVAQFRSIADFAHLNIHLPSACADREPFNGKILVGKSRVSGPLNDCPC